MHIKISSTKLQWKWQWFCYNFMYEVINIGVVRCCVQCLVEAYSLFMIYANVVRTNNSTLISNIVCACNLHVRLAMYKLWVTMTWTVQGYLHSNHVYTKEMRHTESNVGNRITQVIRVAILEHKYGHLIIFFKSLTFIRSGANSKSEAIWCGVRDTVDPLGPWD